MSGKGLSLSGTSCFSFPLFIASSGLAGWEKAVIIIGCLCFVAGTITCIVVIVMMMMKKKKEKRKQLGPTNSDGRSLRSALLWIST